MRRRLIVTYVSLLGAVLLALSIPLGLVRTASDARVMYLDRLGDTVRFASQAEPALQTGRTSVLDAELRHYDEMFGVAAIIVGRDGRIVLSSRTDVDISEARREIDSALAGQRAVFPGVPWPWTTEPVIVAEPVGRGNDIIGAAVTISPVGALSTATLRTWGLLATFSGIMLLLGAIASIPMSRWMLRPIRDLDDAVHALAEGKLHDDIDAATGPPELRRLGRKFAAMADRITRLLQRQRTFASYASHQLRTPLATLRLSVENLGPAVATEGIDDYTMVTEEIDRMARLCDGLLSYALAEVVEGDMRDIDAVAVTDARVHTWRQAAARAGVALHWSASGTILVRAAHEALDQALDALLSNAIKFAGPDASVTVAVDPPIAGLVTVHVVDSGPGMPASDLARAAEPFWRRSSDQNIEGAGLGIAIADALVTASGGRLTLSEAQPHGVHARITLPTGTSA